MSEKSDFALFGIIWYLLTSFYIILHHFCIILHHFASFCIIWQHFAAFGIIWHHLASFGIMTFFFFFFFYSSSSSSFFFFFFLFSPRTFVAPSPTFPWRFLVRRSPWCVSSLMSILLMVSDLCYGYPF